MVRHETRNLFLGGAYFDNKPKREIYNVHPSRHDANYETDEYEQFSSGHFVDRRQPSTNELYINTEIKGNFNRIFIRHIIICRDKSCIK